MYRIEKVETVTVGTQAVTVRINGLPCMIQNNGPGDAYFKEFRDDGVEADNTNGWLLGPGESTQCPMVVRELSVIAGGTDADVRILVMDEV